MGSSNDKIYVAIIDSKNKQQDFTQIKENKNIQSNYFNTFQSFLQKQSLKDLSYLIIRSEQGNSKKFNYTSKKSLEQKSIQSSIYKKIKDDIDEITQSINNQKSNKTKVKESNLKDKLINYIKKYSLEKLIIYMLVQNIHDIRISQADKPYFTLITDKINVITEHLLQRPKGVDPLQFKFKRLIKDLYRRTNVKIYMKKNNNNKNKQPKAMQQNQKKWRSELQKYSLSFDITYFDQNQFKKSLICQYYDNIVICQSQTLTIILDVKKKQKLDFNIIYFGDLSKFGDNQSENRNQLSLKKEKDQVWYENNSIQQIVTAIYNCTDIVQRQSKIAAQNIIIFTKFQYHQEQFIKQTILSNLKIRQTLPDKEKFKSKDIKQPGWTNKLQISVVSNYNKLKQQIQRAKSVYCYLITFDFTVDQIQKIKFQLNKNECSKRVYMYNSHQKQSKIKIIQQYLKEQRNADAIKLYVQEGVNKILNDASFQIKFEISPIQKITVYGGDSKLIDDLTNKMGLIVVNIKDKQQFKKNYIYDQKRKNIIIGHVLLTTFNKYKQIQTILNNLDQYPGKLKIIIFDNKKQIFLSWDKIKQLIQNHNIFYAHYNLNKLQELFQFLNVPLLNFTIFKKKSLPRFFSAIQKLQQSKIVHLNLTGSLISKKQLLKEVFQDENFRLSTQFQVKFYKLSKTNNNIQSNISTINDDFLRRYCDLWRTGYQIVSQNNNKIQKRQSVQTKKSHRYQNDVKQMLRQDIKKCLYKCKSYKLLNVSDTQFNQFYIKTLDRCNTFLQLQISMMYIISLPHGLCNAIQLLFDRPKFTCMAPKTFGALLICLTLCFIKFQDQVLNKQRVILYIEDIKQHFQGIKNITVGDVLFNSGFLMCGKDQDAEQVSKNHCIFFQFQNIPFLHNSKIKNYLYIQRFSFYKQSTQYLIAPYTQFTVKSITTSSQGKTHITLLATGDINKSFVSRILTSNNINQQLFFQQIREEVKGYLNKQISHPEQKQIKQKDSRMSLYKKAQLISLYEQKNLLINSINEGLQHHRFIQSLHDKKIMSAMYYLDKHECVQRHATQLQILKFQNMLGVDKAVLNYQLCQYEVAINWLNKVLQFLQQQGQQQKSKWAKRKIKYFKNTIIDIQTKRAKYLNKLQKKKNWKIQNILQEEKSYSMIQQQNKIQWQVDYSQSSQEFFIIQKQSNTQLFHYNIKPSFGQHAPPFPQNSAYMTKQQRQKKNFEDKKLKTQKQINQKSYNQSINLQSRDVLLIQKNENDKNNKKNSILPAIQKKKSPEKKQIQLKLQSKQSIKQSEKKIEKIVQIKKIQKVQEKIQKNQKISSKIQKQQVQQDIQLFNVQIFKQQSLLSSSSKTAQRHDIQFTEEEKLFGVNKTIQWQAFFYDNDFIIVKKGKSYKKKIIQKI